MRLWSEQWASWRNTQLSLVGVAVPAVTHFENNNGEAPCIKSPHIQSLDNTSDHLSHKSNILTNMNTIRAFATSTSRLISIRFKDPRAYQGKPKVEETIRLEVGARLREEGWADATGVIAIIR